MAGQDVGKLVILEQRKNQAAEENEKGNHHIRGIGAAGIVLGVGTGHGITIVY